MSTAIFLGAGASKSDDAPLQSELFLRYFENTRNRRGHGEIERELRTYFDLAFGIDVDSPELDESEFPTFEEAIGMLDLAESRGEAFREFDRVGLAANSGRIRKIRLYLVYAMATAIKEQVGQGKDHATLVGELQREDLLQEVIFLSSNYDILIDNSLGDELGGTHPGRKIDYGVEFKNHSGWGYPGDDAISLYKIHGSLNWVFCPVCNDVIITPFQKGAAKIASRPREYACDRCRTLRAPIIVPPTLYKDISNVHLSKIWNRAEKDLIDVDQIIFCGYSLPAADTHIKYLLKRAETNRQGRNLEVKVVNSHRGKEPETKEAERRKFERFFVGDVSYLDASFWGFASSPGDFM